METKKLYSVLLLWGEGFYTPEGECVCYIHENDGTYRPEYMDDIIEYFGGEIVSLGHVKERDLRESDIDPSDEEPTQEFMRVWVPTQVKKLGRK